MKLHRPHARSYCSILECPSTSLLNLPASILPDAVAGANCRKGISASVVAQIRLLLTNFEIRLVFTGFVIRPSPPPVSIEVPQVAAVPRAIRTYGYHGACYGPATLRSHMPHRRRTDRSGDTCRFAFGDFQRPYQQPGAAVPPYAHQLRLRLTHFLDILRNNLIAYSQR